MIELDEQEADIIAKLRKVAAAEPDKEKARKFMKICDDIQAIFYEWAIEKHNADRIAGSRDV